jgi:hypothetical protein
MRSVKPSVYILEGLSTGFNMGVSAPHLIQKWLTGHSRPRSCCLTFMLFFLRPTPQHAVETFNRPEIFSDPPSCRVPASLKILRKSYGPFSFCETL